MSHTFGRAEKAYYDRDYSFGEVIKRLWLFSRSEKKMLFILLLAFAFNTGISIGVPLFLRVAIDEIAKTVGVNFVNVKLYGWFYFAGTIITWITMYLIIRIEWTIISRTVTKLRNDMFIQLQEHDLSFFDRNKTGRIMSRVVNDTWELGNFMLIFVEITVNFLNLVVMLVIMFAIEWRLTLGILIIAPFIFIVMGVMGYFLMKFSRESRLTVAAVNGAMQESIAGIAIAKNFAREAKNKQEFYDLNKTNLRANIKRSLTFSILFPIFDFIASAIIFIIIFQGARYVVSAVISVGDLYLFYMYSLNLMGPLIGVSQQVAQFQAGRASAERIFSILEVPSLMISGTKDLGEIKGQIEFKDVLFGYSDEKTLFDGINLFIPAGQNVAIVGHTGSGKTSLISILAHFYEIISGEILIDGNNIRDLDIDKYRKHLGIVLQDPYLFSGNIKDNILYGNPEATEKELEQAVSASHVTDFVEFLPEGLETDVGERGSKLSMGQRQLISMSRALIANPRILILDEATASVDAYTESLIQDGLEELFKNRTSIVIAHRLSTVIGADRILVFEEGKIVGDGTHTELMKHNKAYQELYKTYYEFQGVF